MSSLRPSSPARGAPCGQRRELVGPQLGTRKWDAPAESVPRSVDEVDAPPAELAADRSIVVGQRPPLLDARIPERAGELAHRQVRERLEDEERPPIEG